LTRLLLLENGSCREKQAVRSELRLTIASQRAQSFFKLHDKVTFSTLIGSLRIVWVRWDQGARPISPVYNPVDKVVDKGRKLVDSGGEAGITTPGRRDSPP
jgi:hypothetical protein